MGNRVLNCNIQNNAFSDNVEIKKKKQNKKKKIKKSRNKVHAIKKNLTSLKNLWPERTLSI